jgi:two-component system nitrogen regulation response regulator GlnG
VGDMSALLQAKVLRLQQEQRFERVGGNETVQTDVRLIAATNQNLGRMGEEGDFRADLFYRLNGMTIPIPPLRDRRHDIPLLLEHFLSISGQELDRGDIQGISPEALEVLVRFDWPGNVRQLQSAVRQAALKATGPVIVPEFLPDDVRGLKPAGGGELKSGLPPSDLRSFVEPRLAAESTDLYAETLEMMERFLITRVLQETGGNQTQAAKLLGITRGKVRERIAAFEISLDKIVSINPHH